MEIGESILKKWRNQSLFPRFLNDNENDISGDNIMWVTLKDMIDNLPSWTVDNTFELTEKEIEFLNSKPDVLVKLFHQQMD